MENFPLIELKKVTMTIFLCVPKVVHIREIDDVYCVNVIDRKGVCGRAKELEHERERTKLFILIC
jgi:hypothetical protein